MKRLKEENLGISTVLAFILIPISGMAMDVYIPSFPHMSTDLGTSAENIKLTLTIYLVSYGLSQLFVGTLVDALGRYKINLLSLVVFILTCLGIVYSTNIYFIFLMRFIQGIAISFIVVCKRSFFIDAYTGSKRKHYTSMLTMVWSTAPIMAPFIGGYLQNSFGWRANFWLLAIYATIMLLLELRYSGETIVIKQKLQLKTTVENYKTLLKNADFSIGTVLLGVSYTMVMIFGMSIPFIVEEQFHLSPVYSGYCALISGVAIFLGGSLGKFTIDKPFYPKLAIANLIQLLVALLMLISSNWISGLWPMMVFVFIIHLFQGFTYNVYFTYCITRFPEFAATSSGISSGGSYLIFSIVSYLIVHVINVVGQFSLSITYISCLIMIFGLLFLVKLSLKKRGVALS